MLFGQVGEVKICLGQVLRVSEKKNQLVENSKLASQKKSKKILILEEKNREEKNNIQKYFIDFSSDETIEKIKN